ncbi:MAG: TlpA family protein disulfide reductase [Elusimicrobia bacterium]|nr:TlpA family protein disulfide reductase [Elusimicrobiota bacterium]
MNPALKLAWRLAWSLRSGRASGLRVGSRLPDFRLLDVGGRPHRLSDAGGTRKTLLWFTNLCADCRSKAPLLADLSRRAAERVAVLAVSVLPPDDPLPLRFAPDCGFPVLLDPEDVTGRRLGLAHPPGTCPINNLFIADEGGTVLFRHHLSALSEAAFRAACREHVGA